MKHISHLDKGILKVIELQGDATGYYGFFCVYIVYNLVTQLARFIYFWLDVCQDSANFLHTCIIVHNFVHFECFPDTMPDCSLLFN